MLWFATMCELSHSLLLRWEIHTRSAHAAYIYTYSQNWVRKTDRERERAGREIYSVNMRPTFTHFILVLLTIDGWQWTWNDNGIIMQIDIIWRNRENTLTRTHTHSLSSSFAWRISAESCLRIHKKVLALIITNSFRAVTKTFSRKKVKKK